MRFERSLIVLKNYLGDTVMATPLVKSVANLSGAMDVLGAPMVEPILRFPGFRTRVYDPGTISELRQLLKVSKQVRQGSYDTAFIVNRSLRSALLVRLAGIKTRIGHVTEGRGRLLTHRVPYVEDRNEAECYLDLLRATGAEIDPSLQKPRLWVSDDERAAAKDFLNGATVGVQPGARHPYKQIPLPVLRQVGQRLIDRGERLAFLGGPEEDAIVQELNLSGVSLAGKTNLRGTMGALANLNLMIGGDTGVMHLAAALDCPTLTVFGPTPAKKWGWFDPPHQVIQAPAGRIENVDESMIEEAMARIRCA